MLRITRSKYVNRIFISLAFLLLFILLFMYVFRVNETIKFDGSVVSNEIEFVQSPCSTYIKDIFVVDGEEVSEGQVIGTYDSESIQTYIQNLQSKIIEANNKKVSIDKTKFEFQQSITQLNTQITQLNVQKEDFIFNNKNEISSTKHQISNVENELNDIKRKQEAYPYEIKTLDNNINNCKIKLANAQNQFDKYKILFESGGISAEELDKYELEVINLTAQLAEFENNKKVYEINNSQVNIDLLQSNLKRLNEYLNELENNDAAYDKQIELKNQELNILKAEQSNYEKQSTEELTFINQEIDNYNNELEYLKTLLNGENGANKEVYMISPCNGTVSLGNGQATQNKTDSNSKKMELVGKRLEKDEVIMKIINSEDIYIEGYISEKDFPYVFEKDKVSITLYAYPYEEYGTIDGVVDTLYKEPLMSSNGTFYKCKINFSSENKDIKTYVGLNVSNSIIVKRDINLIRYFFNNTFNNSQ